MGDFLIVISEDEREEEIRDLCRNFTDICRKFLGISVYCYISNRVFCEEFPQSYASLIQSEKNDVAAMEEIVFVCEAGQNVKEDQDIELPEKLKEAMRRGNKEEFWFGYCNFIDEAVRLRLLDYRALKNILQDILQAFFVYMENHHIQAHQLPLMNFDSVETVEQMNRWVKSCLDAMFERQTLGNPTYNEAVIEKVKNYILNHLGETLGRESIAEHVNLSPDYISKIFKSVTGKNLSQYIIDERMEKAVLLMKTTRLNVSQVAVEVGCDNFSYFSKLFKKHTGLTPREYRASL